VYKNLSIHKKQMNKPEPITTNIVVIEPVKRKPKKRVKKDPPRFEVVKKVVLFSFD